MRLKKKLKKNKYLEAMLHSVTHEANKSIKFIADN